MRDEVSGHHEIHKKNQRESFFLFYSNKTQFKWHNHGHLTTFRSFLNKYGRMGLHKAIKIFLTVQNTLKSAA